MGLVHLDSDENDYPHFLRGKGEEIGENRNFRLRFWRKFPKAVYHVRNGQLSKYGSHFQIDISTQKNHFSPPKMGKIGKIFKRGRYSSPYNAQNYRKGRLNEYGKQVPYLKH